MAFSPPGEEFQSIVLSVRSACGLSFDFDMNKFWHAQVL